MLTRLYTLECTHRELLYVCPSPDFSSKKSGSLIPIFKQCWDEATNFTCQEFSNW